MSVGNVTVREIQNGWILSKTNGDKTSEFQYTDDNKNGKIDSTDTKKVISMDAGDLTTAEFEAASKSIMEEKAKEGETVGDWYRRKATQEEEEARAEAFDRQQRQQRMAQYESGKKKKGFWSKLGNGILMGLSAISGIGLGFYGGGWQYSSGNFNDWNLRMFSAGTQGLSNMSNYMAAAYGNNGLTGMTGMQSFMPGGAAGGINFEKLWEMQENYLQKQQEQNDARLEAWKKTQEEAKAKADAKEAAKLAEDLYNEYTEEGCDKEINQVNLDKIKAVYQPAKKAEDYKAEDKTILEKIKAYPQIPYELIDDEAEGKINTEFAQKINKLLDDYVNTAEPDLAEGIISTADYNTITGILNSAKTGTLSEENIKKLEEIVKKNLSKLNADEE